MECLSQDPGKAKHVSKIKRIQVSELIKEKKKKIR